MQHPLAVLFSNATIVFAYEITNDVPYIEQLDYDDIGQSACGPTSVTMLIQKYYGENAIDMPKVYHSGTQGYKYNGPHIYYQNVGNGDSWTPNGGSCDKGSDTAFDDIDAENTKYYTPSTEANLYTGMASPEIPRKYLENVWRGTTSVESTTVIADIINDLRGGPLAVNVNMPDSQGTPSFGHWLVLRGYDNNETADETNDDKFFVNDPYDNWNGDCVDGENKEISYSDFSAWYKGRYIKFSPSISPERRNHTVVVDNTDVLLDDVNAKDKNDNYVWQEWYSYGNWLYPIEKGHWVKWKPELDIKGRYKIHVTFHKDSGQGKVKYKVFNSKDELQGEEQEVNQQGTGWASVVIGTYILDPGSYVKIDDVPKDCNVDAVTFEFIERVDVTEDSTIIDTVLIVDSSGSMGWNDPNDNRIEAIRLFVDLAEDDDMISIVDFDSGVDTLAPLQVVGQNREGLKNIAGNIDSSGGTNIGLALQQGFSELDAVQNDHQKFAILLTDGDGDYSNQVQDFIDKGWIIFTIGLSASVNDNLLKNILAGQTGGAYFPLSTTEALGTAFQQIYSSIRNISHGTETDMNSNLVIQQDETVEFIVKKGVEKYFKISKIQNF